MSYNSLRIDSLSLTNFRCFKDLAEPLRFQPDLTVLVAKNGCGKTSILDAIRISLGTFTKGINSFSQASIRKSDATLLPLRIGQGKGASYPVRIAAKGIVGSEECAWERLLESEKGRTTTKEAKAISHFGAYLKECASSDDSTPDLPIIAFYGTSRLWKGTLEPDGRAEWDEHNFASEDCFVGYEDALTADSIYAQVKRWMSYASVVKANPVESDTAVGRSIAAQYAAVESAVDEVLMGTGYRSPHYSFTYKDVALIEEDQDSYASIAVPVSWTSDGIKAVFSLVADIAYRCSRLNPSYGVYACKRTQGIVMIDEVDLFLHPAWQQRILPDLRRVFPKIQFIVSTHSPQVVSSVPRECVRIITPEGAQPFLSPTLGVEVKDILLSIFGTGPVPQGLKIVEKLDRLIAMTGEGLGDSEAWKQLYDELRGYYGDDYGPLLGAVRHKEFLRRLSTERENA